VLDLDTLRAGNEIQGFGYVSKTSGSLSISSFSLGAGSASSTFTSSVDAPNSDTASLVQVKFSGVGNTDVNNKWVSASNFYFRNSTPSYDVIYFTQRVGGTQKHTIQFYNSTGVGVTVPSMTVYFKVYYYTAPW